MDLLNIRSVEAPHRCAIIKLSGELDIASAPALREQLLITLSQSPNRLILDLAGLEFMDSSGISVLVGTDRRAKLLDCDFALASPKPIVARVLELCGLSSYFPVFPTVADAMAASHPALNKSQVTGNGDGASTASSQSPA